MGTNMEEIYREFGYLVEDDDLNALCGSSYRSVNYSQNRQGVEDSGEEEIYETRAANSIDKLVPKFEESIDILKKGGVL
jgi:hypothetical protein